MKKEAENYLMNLFEQSPNYQLWIPKHLQDIREKFRVVDKQIYATLLKWSKKGVIDYGTSINGHWLTKRYK